MYVRSRFLTRRGVLELAMSIEACMLSWLEGGCLSTPSTPPVSAPALQNHGIILDIGWIIQNREGGKLWVSKSNIHITVWGRLPE